MTHCIIFSISNDFGIALANDWLNAGHVVTGTYRTYSDRLDKLAHKGAVLHKCDMGVAAEINFVCEKMNLEKWDVLCIAPASLDPVGEFIKTDFDEWEHSIQLNFTSQMRALHQMLPARNIHTENGPIVILFAGGGTNNATMNYSAYTVSKIAQIKMTELLDAEVFDTRFTIIGPGWVKTKIHESTIKAGIDGAGGNFQKTIDKLTASGDVPVEKVVECCNWAIGAKRKIISGRNFSLVFDKWGDEELDVILLQNNEMYKLRRHGN